MPYDETHNYKITAKLKLNREWFVSKTAVFILVSIISFTASFFFLPGFKEKIYQVCDIALVKVYEKINGFNESISSNNKMVLNYIDLERKHRELQMENEDLKFKIATYEHAIKENHTLKKILKYSVNNSKKILSTQMLTKSIDGYVDLARIPVGSINGIRENDTVVDKDKLVGRVSEVHERYSKISLITNPDMALPAIFSETNIKAILRGGYDGKLVVKILHGDGDMPKKGELALTSGNEYNFPSGMAIGVVSNVELDSIEVEPFFDINKIYLVSILRG